MQKLLSKGTTCTIVKRKKDNRETGKELCRVHWVCRVFLRDKWWSLRAPVKTWTALHPQQGLCKLLDSLGLSCSLWGGSLKVTSATSELMFGYCVWHMLFLFFSSNNIQNNFNELYLPNFYFVFIWLMYFLFIVGYFKDKFGGIIKHSIIMSWRSQVT